MLAAASVVLGVLPRLADGLVGAAADSLDRAVGAVHLAVWHGFNVELALSAVALAGGIALFLARRPVGAVLATGEHLPTAGGGYIATLRGLNARRQPGDRRVPARLAPRLPRRHPAHRRARARRAPPRRDVVAGLAATPSTCRSTCRSRPC